VRHNRPVLPQGSAGYGFPVGPMSHFGVGVLPHPAEGCSGEVGGDGRACSSQGADGHLERLRDRAPGTAGLAQLHNSGGVHLATGTANRLARPRALLTGALDSGPSPVDKPRPLITILLRTMIGVLQTPGLLLLSNPDRREPALPLGTRMG